MRPGPANAEFESQLEAQAASTATTNKELICSARLGVSAEALKKALSNTIGITVSKPSTEESRLFDADIPRKESVAKHMAAQQASRHKADAEPGNLLIFDAYSAPHAPSVVNGGIHQLGCVELQPTSYKLIGSRKAVHAGQR